MERLLKLYMRDRIAETRNTGPKRTTPTLRLPAYPKQHNSRATPVRGKGDIKRNTKFEWRPILYYMQALAPAEKTQKQAQNR